MGRKEMEEEVSWKMKGREGGRRRKKRELSKGKINGGNGYLEKIYEKHESGMEKRRKEK